MSFDCTDRQQQPLTKFVYMPPDIAVL